MKFESVDPVASVFDTNESVAKNCIWEMRPKASVADGWRKPLAAFGARLGPSAS